MILPPAALEDAVHNFARDNFFAADTAADSTLEVAAEFACTVVASAPDAERLAHVLTDRAREAEARRRHARAKLGWELTRLLNRKLPSHE